MGVDTSFGLTVSAEDDQGNVDTAYSGPIALTLGENPGGSTLSGVLVMGATDGVAVFTGLSLDVPGNGYTLLVSAYGLISAITDSFDVAFPASQAAITARHSTRTREPAVRSRCTSKTATAIPEPNRAFQTISPTTTSGAGVSLRDEDEQVGDHERRHPGRTE